MICTEFDVLAHESSVHLDKVDSESILNKLLLNGDGTLNNLPNAEWRSRIVEVGTMDMTGKVTV